MIGSQAGDEACHARGREECASIALGGPRRDHGERRAHDDAGLGGRTWIRSRTSSRLAPSSRRISSEREPARPRSASTSTTSRPLLARVDASPNAMFSGPRARPMSTTTTWPALKDSRRRRREPSQGVMNRRRLGRTRRVERDAQDGAALREGLDQVVDIFDPPLADMPVRASMAAPAMMPAMRHNAVMRWGQDWQRLRGPPRTERPAGVADHPVGGAGLSRSTVPTDLLWETASANRAATSLKTWRWFGPRQENRRGPSP